jgi:hypothetical protein
MLLLELFLNFGLFNILSASFPFGIRVEIMYVPQQFNITKR